MGAMDLWAFHGAEVRGQWAGVSTLPEAVYPTEHLLSVGVQGEEQRRSHGWHRDVFPAVSAMPEGASS